VLTGVAPVLKGLDQLPARVLTGDSAKAIKISVRDETLAERRREIDALREEMGLPKE
jgi:hypothetical protein